jgi:WD40 repeat protein
MIEKLQIRYLIGILLCLLLSNLCIGCAEQSTFALPTFTPQFSSVPKVTTTSASNIPSPAPKPNDLTLQSLHSVNNSTGHIGEIDYALWSYDGTRLISLGLDKSIRVFDMTGTQLGTMRHSSSAEFVSLAISNNDKMLVSASIDGVIMIWDINTFQLIKKFDVKIGFDIAKVIFTPDDKYLVSVNLFGAMGSLLIDLSSGKAQEIFTTKEQITAFTGSSKSGNYIYGFANGKIKIWNYSSRTFTDLEPTKLGYEPGVITTLTITDSGAELIGIVDNYPKILILRLNIQNQLVKILSYHDQAQLSGVRYANLIDIYQNRIAVGTRKGEIVIVDTETANIITTLTGHTKDVVVKFNKTNGLLLSAGGDGSLKVWNPTDQATVLTIASGNKAVTNSLAISSDNKLFAGGFADGTLTIWDIASGKEIAQIKAHKLSISLLTFSPDGNFLATVAEDANRGPKFDDEVKIWSVPEGQLVTSYNNHRNRITTILFTNDSKQLISSGFNKDLLIYDLESRVPSNFATTSDVVFSLALSSDNKLLGLHTRDNIVHVYDFQTKQETSKWKGELGWWPLTFTWNHQSILVQTPTLTQWDALKGIKQKVVVQENISYKYFSVSNDDKYILGVDTNSDILTLWDLERGVKKATVSLPITKAGIAAISKDGSVLLLSPPSNSKIDVFSIKV